MIVAIEYPCFGPRFVLTLNMKNLTDWNLLDIGKFLFSFFEIDKISVVIEIFIQVN